MKRSGIDVVFIAILAHIGCTDEPPKKYGRRTNERCEMSSCRMYGEHDEHEPVDPRPGRPIRPKYRRGSHGARRRWFA